MRGSSTGDPASHRTQDKRSHPASGAQAGTGRSALRPETVAEMRGASDKRPSAAIMLGRRLRIQRNLGQRNKPPGSKSTQIGQTPPVVLARLLIRELIQEQQFRKSL